MNFEKHIALHFHHHQNYSCHHPSMDLGLISKQNEIRENKRNLDGERE